MDCEIFDEDIHKLNYVRYRFYESTTYDTLITELAPDRSWYKQTNIRPHISCG